MTHPCADRFSFEDPIDELEKRLTELERNKPAKRAGDGEASPLAQARCLRRELIDLKQMIYATLES